MIHANDSTANPFDMNNIGDGKENDDNKENTSQINTVIIKIAADFWNLKINSLTFQEQLVRFSLFFLFYIFF